MRRIVLGATLGLLVGCGVPPSTEQYSRNQVGGAGPKQPCMACPDPLRGERIANWLKRPELTAQLQPLVKQAEVELTMAKNPAAVDAILDQLLEDASLYAQTH